MFKSVFAKYVSAVMAIFVVGFTVLLVVMTSIVGNSLSNDKAEEMNEVGQTAGEYIMFAVGDCSADRFVETLYGSLEDPQRQLATLLSALTVTDEDIDLLIADSSGRFCYRVNKTVQGKEVPGGLMQIPELPTGKSKVWVEQLELFPQEVLLSVTEIRGIGGECLGYAAVTSSIAANGRMMLELTKTVISSALLVLLAVMIAVYFISERVTCPLREMSTAAKRFAGGKFDTRVVVHGNDEVAELAVAFNQMADSLQNLDKMRSSFIANVSHDLRTPMTTIAGFIDGIRDGVIPPEERDYYLGVIAMEVQRLSRLVSSLLDLSRIQAGDRKFTPEEFDICEMGRLILISFEKQLEEKQLQVEFESEDDRMLAYADRDAIYQIFYNICHNAVKFSAVGGLFRIRITSLDRKLQVAVYNEGQGIPKEDLPYVFERFYKSDKSRGLDKTGVGLGLYISKTIIEAHGERIRVESECGKSCEFFFTLARPGHH